jgi:hypothetical protein
MDHLSLEMNFLVFHDFDERPNVWVLFFDSLIEARMPGCQKKPERIKMKLAKIFTLNIVVRSGFEV